jgi:hypothetical protein
MADITLTFTTSNLNEVKAALQYHKGADAGSQSNADLKAFLVRRVNSIVKNYRTQARDAANPVSATSTVSA